MAIIKNNQSVELNMKCKAFSCEGVRLNKLLVEPGVNGAVLVWDSIAGHYTNCHSLSERTQKRARREALHAWKMKHFHGV